MKHSYFLIAAIAVTAFFSGLTVNAQITIQIPKIPKIKKPKNEPATTTGTAATENDNRSNQTSPPEKKTDEPKYEPLDPRIGFFLDELGKAQKQVDDYTPEDKIYLVSTTSSEWLWRAVSARQRAEFTDKWKPVMTPAAMKRFDEGFVALAASAAKKLPSYKSNISKYSFHNAAEEKMIKGVLGKITDFKIFSSGLEQSAWLIDKNDYGLPTARYKHGVIYLRNTTSDHPYCYATYVNIKQDYAGGGTYGASYARFIEDEMVGCPAGK